MEFSEASEKLNGRSLGEVNQGNLRTAARIKRKDIAAAVENSFTYFATHSLAIFRFQSSHVDLTEVRPVFQNGADAFVSISARSWSDAVVDLKAGAKLCEQVVKSRLPRSEMLVVLQPCAFFLFEENQLRPCDAEHD